MRTSFTTIDQIPNTNGRPSSSIGPHLRRSQDPRNHRRSPPVCDQCHLRPLPAPPRPLPGPLWARVTRFYWVSVLISGQQHLRTHALHQKYGPVVRIAPNTLSFSSHLAIKTIYGRGASSLAKPDGSGSGFLPAGDPSIFFANEPAMHARLRRHIAHAYSMTSVAQMEPSVAVLVQEFIRKVDSFAGTGEVFDLVEWVNHLTFDLIGELGYGSRFGFMEKGMHYISPFFLTLSAFPALRRILEPVVVVRLPPPKSPRGVPHLLSIANAIIAERGASLTPLTEKDLLGGFLASKRSDGDPLSPSTVLGDVMATLVAGADTTAAFIQGLSYYLLQHPPALQRLQRELDTHCPATYADTLPLEYFQAVVKETLRLSPSIGSMFPRLVPSGGAELLPGVWVPGGTVVGVNNWVVGRDKSLYGEDAMEFRPERWLEDQGKAKPRFTEFEFAFGGGDWVCIGRNVAMMEICKVVPRLFAGFEMEMVEPEKPWVETAGQFLFKSKLKVRARRRAEGTWAVGGIM